MESPSVTKRVTPGLVVGLARLSPS